MNVHLRELDLGEDVDLAASVLFRPAEDVTRFVDELVPAAEVVQRSQAFRAAPHLAQP